MRRSKVSWIKSSASNIPKKEEVILSKNFLTVAIVSVFMLLIVGCSSKQEAPAPTLGNMVIVKFGPEVIHAGKIFNAQPNGVSAIWAQTKNATPATVLVLNGVQLKSSVEKNGTLVTAFVPGELYEKAGEYPLYLLDTKVNQKSNDVKFVVNP